MTEQLPTAVASTLLQEEVTRHLLVVDHRDQPAHLDKMVLPPLERCLHMVVVPSLLLPS